ncbi:MAG: hypothetical protein EA383_07475 [Spirochaetaceae bacterium]|nr:MAG: hypothetical protein EA383_07475 [Spirochaetaceae bacterium]
MKQTVKTVLLVGVFTILAVTGLAAQSAGGGLSVFVPESLYIAGEGSLSIETGFQTAIGIGGGLSVPIGIAYNQIYGLMPSRETDDYTANRPWFYSDSLVTFVLVQASVGSGPVYVNLFGGGAGNWNIAIRPLTVNIEADLSAKRDDSRISFSDTPEITSNFGLGYIAGAALGMRLDFGALELRGSFRNIGHRGTISGTADEISGAVATEREVDLDDIRFRLRGFNLGVNVSVNL